jgi:hypothetical protein
MPTSATVLLNLATEPAYTHTCISATNFFKICRMRSRSLSRSSDGLGWGVWIGIGILILVILGGVALVIYAGTLTPARHSIEQVLPNDSFPK